MHSNDYTVSEARVKSPQVQRTRADGEVGVMYARTARLHEPQRMTPWTTWMLWAFCLFGAFRSNRNARCHLESA